jgi:hypothetical protein
MFSGLDQAGGEITGMGGFRGFFHCFRLENGYRYDYTAKEKQ